LGKKKNTYVDLSQLILNCDFDKYLCKYFQAFWAYCWFSNRELLWFDLVFKGFSCLHHFLS